MVPIQVNINQLRTDSCIYASSFARPHTIPEFGHSTGKLIAPDIWYSTQAEPTPYNGLLPVISTLFDDQ